MIGLYIAKALLDNNKNKSTGSILNNVGFSFLFEQDEEERLKRKKRVEYLKQERKERLKEARELQDKLNKDFEDRLNAESMTLSKERANEIENKVDKFLNNKGD